STCSFFLSSAPHRVLPSFPTRRSSDLSLFREHLWPWLPAYLDAVADLGLPVLTTWAGLIRRAVAAESAGQPAWPALPLALRGGLDRKSTRLNSSHLGISYAVFCLKKKK